MGLDRVAVVGGGITGLAAALRVRQRLPGARITVYEGSPALGGKLRTGTLDGRQVELGAEAFLCRDPAGGDSAVLALARELGLGDELVHPATGRAAIAVNGLLLPIPAGTLVGVPGDPGALPPLAHPTADDRDTGAPLLGPDEDVAVGALVRARLGDEVADRLVDPMLGGVYAGRADHLSLAATMPGLARACRQEHTLAGAVRHALGALPRSPGQPVFATIAGGLTRLVDATAAATAARISLGAPVRELSRDGHQWRLVHGPTRAPVVENADAVILAVPARPAARLLDQLEPGAAGLVGALDYASLALVTFVLPAGATLPELSGLLAPASPELLVKAATFFSAKWEHLRQHDGAVLLRASVGRHGDERALQRDDDALAAAVLGDLNRLLPAPLPAPLASHVQRWGGALPQYRPGHLDRVAAARAALAAHPTLALAGAAYDGVGIPVCVKSGQAAADHIMQALTEGTP
ncbi:protoporphyrinogen oxidase [Pilimelia columellifera]|uniref:Coproporphyrinogen III oxidase n=1 Tax=Pilimelia columellifera subsp. columellifera TaxID=706583 RepID=A0ABP6B061_9ACTN